MKREFPMRRCRHVEVVESASTTDPHRRLDPPARVDLSSHEHGLLAIFLAGKIPWLDHVMPQGLRSRDVAGHFSAIDAK